VNYKDFFRNKRIAVIGLGPHGEMVADIKFLLRNKAQVLLYDMRSDKKLKSFLPELKEVGLEHYTFGKVPSDELLNAELIIISPELSKKSMFLKKATQAEIQIEYPDTLFFKLAPSVTLIGVMGVCGKSTVAHLIYTILKKAFVEHKDQGLFFIDPESTNGALTHLKKIKKGDVVLARIPDALLPHYYEIHISPHVAVITSKIAFDILEFQTYNNFIVAPDGVVDAIKSHKNLLSKAKILRTRGSSIPADWQIKTKAVYDRENAALAIQTSELFKVPPEVSREVIQTFMGLKGRIELVKKVSGIEFYNDASSTSPQATLSALMSLASGKNIVLIIGGAYTGHDYSPLIKNISEYVSTIILLPGSGTIGFRADIESIPELDFVQVLSLEDAVKEALGHAKKGDKVLFSPGFDAVGVDVSRRERGERFVKAVRGL
jgi:UDP-N-acetylmuramoylalanine--D-glutamate ligase